MGTVLRTPCVCSTVYMIMIMMMMMFCRAQATTREYSSYCVGSTNSEQDPFRAPSEVERVAARGVYPFVFISSKQNGRLTFGLFLAA